MLKSGLTIMFNIKYIFPPTSSRSYRICPFIFWGGRKCVGEKGDNFVSVQPTPDLWLTWKDFKGILKQLKGFIGSIVQVASLQTFSIKMGKPRMERDKLQKIFLCSFLFFPVCFWLIIKDWMI